MLFAANLLWNRFLVIPLNVILFLACLLYVMDLDKIQSSEMMTMVQLLRQSKVLCLWPANQSTFMYLMMMKM